MKVKHIQSIISARFLGGLQKDKSSGYLASIAIGYPQDYPLVRWIERPPRPAPPGIATFFGFVAIVLARTLTVVDGVSALQDLRSKLLIAAAEKREREEWRRAANEVVFKPGPLGPDFGRKVAFPGGSPPQAR